MATPVRVARKGYIACLHTIEWVIVTGVRLVRKQVLLFILWLRPDLYLGLLNVTANYSYLAAQRALNKPLLPKSNQITFGSLGHYWLDCKNLLILKRWQSPQEYLFERTSNSQVSYNPFVPICRKNLLQATKYQWGVMGQTNYCEKTTFLVFRVSNCRLLVKVVSQRRHNYLYWH